MAKAITIKNPWAHLIAVGIKDVENRTWRTKYRGKVLIHASQKIEYYKNLTLVQLKSLDHENQRKVVKQDFITSAIIGSVEIADCIQNSKSIWAVQDHWHWVLKNPVLFDTPILNVKGALSFWDFNQELPEEKQNVVPCNNCQGGGCTPVEDQVSGYSRLL